MNDEPAPKVQRFSWVEFPDASDRKKFDLQLGSAKDDESRLAAVLQGSRIELKTERFQWEKTGNIFVEYQNRGDPSGLAATEADFWCHELARDDETKAYLLFPIEHLKEVARTKLKTKSDITKGGDGGQSRGILLSLRDLLFDLGRRR